MNSPEGTVSTVRLAAVGDLHCSERTREFLHALFAAVRQHADVLVMCGDLTDYGTPEEGHILARELSALQLPMIAVLGNHDYETNQADELRKILIQAGVNVLDGESCEVHGIGFAGTKGFCGGFGQRALGAWGEPGIKRFVQEAIEEALKLERALARLQTATRIAVLHYSPILATVEGESPEVYPFLGSSRLEEPLNRFHVTAAFHGHAHKGTAEGRTEAGVPVYNVALPLMLRDYPGQPPFRVLQVRTVSYHEPSLRTAVGAPPSTTHETETFQHRAPA